jgi:hypothetical protein
MIDREKRYKERKVISSSIDYSLYTSSEVGYQEKDHDIQCDHDIVSRPDNPILTRDMIVRQRKHERYEKYLFGERETWDS